jgi:dUTP pyrophosphatase
MFAVLSREDLLTMVRAIPPLVDNLRDIEQQIQPNGVDLTVKEVALFSTAGRLARGNEARVLSDTTPLVFDSGDSVQLSPGCYLITYNEIINLPRDVMALGMPRSSLLRCGVGIHTAVWDAGYSGRSQSLMVIYNPHGYRLHKDARVVQLVFFRLRGEVAEGYKGMFQGENT